MLYVAVGLASTAVGAAPSRVATVVVRGTRVHVGDLVSGLPDAIQAVDLGPAPALEGSRLISRLEVTGVLADHGADPAVVVAEGYRVRRQLRVLTAADIAAMVRDAIPARLPRGATLGRVLPRQSVTVPDGWTDVRCEVPHPPHRAGLAVSNVLVSLYNGPDALWTLTVPVELVLSDDAVAFDVPRGSHVTVVVRRGLVEVRATGTVNVDADIGDLAPVTVLPSGRALPGRVEDATTVVLVER